MGFRENAWNFKKVHEILESAWNTEKGK